MSAQATLDEAEIVDALLNHPWVKKLQADSHTRKLLRGVAVGECRAISGAIKGLSSSWGVLRTIKEFIQIGVRSVRIISDTFQTKCGFSVESFPWIDRGSGLPAHPDRDKLLQWVVEQMMEVFDLWTGGSVRKTRGKPAVKKRPRMTVPKRRRAIREELAPALIAQFYSSMSASVRNHPLYKNAFRLEYEPWVVLVRDTSKNDLHKFIQGLRQSLLGVYGENEYNTDIQDALNSLSMLGDLITWANHGYNRHIYDDIIMGKGALSSSGQRFDQKLRVLHATFWNAPKYSKPAVARRPKMRAPKRRRTIREAARLPHSQAASLNQEVTSWKYLPMVADFAARYSKPSQNREVWDRFIRELGAAGTYTDWKSSFINPLVDISLGLVRATGSGTTAQINAITNRAITLTDKIEAIHTATSSRPGLITGVERVLLLVCRLFMFAYRNLLEVNPTLRSPVRVPGLRSRAKPAVKKRPKMKIPKRRRAIREASIRYTEVFV